MSIIWLSSRLRNFLLLIEVGESCIPSLKEEREETGNGRPPDTGNREENIKQMETTSSGFPGCEHVFFLPPTNRDSEELPSNSSTAVKKKTLNSTFMWYLLLLFSKKGAA